MRPELYRQLAEIEDHHWWFVHRRRLAADWLRRMGFSEGRRGLDVGCGTGGNLAFLAPYCRHWTGVDIAPDALGFCRARFPEGDFVEGDANQLRALFAPRSFDLITDFNVLYHRWILSEDAVLRQIYDLLRPGGVVLITEPAFPVLFRQHDRQDFGARRYRIGAFRQRLEGCGFVDIRTTYFNGLGFLPALALAAVDRMSGDGNGERGAAPGAVAELRVGSPVLNRSVGAVMAAERAAINIFGRIPFGVGLLCAARRPINQS